MIRHTALFLLMAMAGWAATERDTAEWVIRNGGRVMLNGQRAPYGDLLGLPEGEFRITGVDLFGTLISATELEKLSGLTELKELYLPGPMFNPASGSRLDANAQLKFLGGLQKLERLSFSLHFLTHVNVQDKGVALLTRLAALKEFRCSQCKLEKLSLAPFENLHSLDLSNSEFSDEAMKGLEQLKGLKRLSLRRAALGRKPYKRGSPAAGSRPVQTQPHHCQPPAGCPLRSLRHWLQARLRASARRLAAQ